MQPLKFHVSKKRIRIPINARTRPEKGVNSSIHSADGLLFRSRHVWRQWQAVAKCLHSDMETRHEIAGGSIDLTLVPINISIAAPCKSESHGERKSKATRQDIGFGPQFKEWVRCDLKAICYANLHWMARVRSGDRNHFAKNGAIGLWEKKWSVDLLIEDDGWKNLSIIHSGQIKSFLSPVLKNGGDTLAIHHFLPNDEENTFS